jgi:hypothetical protein
MRLVDPIAQSFYVSQTSGFFATAIDLFFYSKDTTFPVTIQLRPLTFGQPSDDIHQYSEVVLYPSSILTSNNGTIATRVTFDSPVFLSGETFHSICISSNSDQYRVHVSRLSEIDLATNSSGNGVIVSRQPLSGSFFRSQNGLTWTPIQTDDLKFTLYRANFKSSQGYVNFYNSELGEFNDQIAVLEDNPIDMQSRTIRVGIGSTLLSTSLTGGNIVAQLNSTGTGIFVGAAGSATSTLKVINAGIGYTPSSGSLTYNNVPLNSITGSGRNATANITITNGSVASIGATISSGGNGYLIGDVLEPTSIGVANLGLNMQLSVQSTAGFNEIILTNVQGQFETNDPSKTLTYIGTPGITSDLYFNSTSKAYPNSIVVTESGDHFKVNHRNHGMHSTVNKVILNDVSSDLTPTRLTTAYSNTSTADISVENASIFTTFEGLPVSVTNPGYIRINDEILSYTGVSGNALTNITRSIDQTLASTYSALSNVMKYELNGVSLRRINTTFTLSDSTQPDSIGLDHYKLKVNFSQAGKLSALPQGQTDRTAGSTLGRLFFKKTQSSGGTVTRATQNIPFEIIKPLVETRIFPSTSLGTKIRTISGTSISGSELSYSDKGFIDIDLSEKTYFNSPRIVASKVNEDQNLSSLPGKKSLTLNVELNSSNSYVSPIINLERVALSFTSNRVNDLISNFETDDRVATLLNDPSAFVYASVPLQLELPANSLKVYVTAHVNVYNEIRCLYSVSNDPNESLVYYPFPGYRNLDTNQNIINIANNSGIADVSIPKETQIGFESSGIQFKEYTFTMDNLPSFRYYSIKLVGTSTNQAYPPRVKDLRVVALAG